MSTITIYLPLTEKETFKIKIYQLCDENGPYILDISDKVGNDKFKNFNSFNAKTLSELFDKFEKSRIMEYVEMYKN